MKLPTKYDRRFTGTSVILDADGAEICSFGHDEDAKDDAIEASSKDYFNLF